MKDWPAPAPSQASQKALIGQAVPAATESDNRELQLGVSHPQEGPGNEAKDEPIADELFAPLTVPWVFYAQMHVVAKLVDGEQLTLCRLKCGSPFHTRPRQSGIGILNLHADGPLCARCATRMSSGLFARIEANCI